MTQLIVSLDDSSMIGDIKQAIRLLRGVVSVRETGKEDYPNAGTLRAIEELESGNTTLCSDFDAYLKLVSRELPD